MQGVVTNESIGTLSEAIELIRDTSYPHELQLDLKPYRPLDRSTLENLLLLISPVKDRIRVSSVADWTLRFLRRLDSRLLIGFDPLLYLDIATRERYSLCLPPFRLGSYGYRDDHPLSSYKWGHIAEYLSARAEALYSQVPFNAVWFIRASLLAQVLADGFDWIGYLHAHGMQVGAWTLDAENPDQIELAQYLIDASIDRITTNDVQHLSNVLHTSAMFQ